MFQKPVIDVRDRSENSGNYGRTSLPRALYLFYFPRMRYSYSENYDIWLVIQLF